ncbi:putative mitochondrial genome maintenance protein Mgm101 [Aspergillus clavatus NRRL 1]|uniref:Mitochondrial genome maintenance protein MGM101 n=1 Tax=Aspergillus clavatus (strain ATCC 1007 / CBS 513.65 / DSM 816 / NCTC 3887 / NRRL 1 / QM 1276 / 107) TaxID=344612 RepID=A1CT11_ASPCL|nr:mitochondrial genome maintenance protein Mgm101, putative [Aspergillus clavatus NRRL 1]EAW06448.1 mitochondrial genome maintenance protein Mgm101, putative [Aspergillus clavatus NRRL 1]
MASSSHLRRTLWLAESSIFRAPSLSARVPNTHLIQTRPISQNPTRQSAQQSTKPVPNPKPTTPASAATTPTPTPTTSTTSTDRAARILAPTPNQPTTPNISKTGLSDKPLELETTTEEKIDWTRSFHGLSAAPFPKEAADILLAEVSPDEVEIKPDGILYLPEIKYRRILNRAFGPGGWGLVPRSESIVTPRTVTREYALVCNGRLVSVARGEQDYFSPDGIPTATEGCRSNALVRCCKDLGIASELWDPRWIRKFKAQYTREVFVEHVVSKKRTKIWVRKDDPVGYPWKETRS